MRSVWLVGLVASVAVIAGGFVGLVSNQRERADKRDETLRAVTALSVAHLDAEIDRTATVLRASGPDHAPGDLAELLGESVNICNPADSEVPAADAGPPPAPECTHDEPAAAAAELEDAVEAARAAVGSVVVVTPSGDATDDVVVLAVMRDDGNAVLAQVTARSLLSAEVSLLPQQQLRTPRLVDDTLAPAGAAPSTMDDRRLFALPSASDFVGGPRYVVASAASEVTLPVGQRAVFALALFVGGGGVLLSLAMLITQARRLSRRATTDDLTGLLTRSEFERRAEVRLAERRRRQAALEPHSCTSTAAVIFVDIDGFKRVNDHAGHHTGDEVLLHVADRLRDVAGDDDVVGRWGGDEFVLWIDDAAAFDVSDHAGTIERAVGEISPLDEAPMSCSIGVAFYPGDGGDVAELMRAADESMYDAKRAGHLR